MFGCVCVCERESCVFLKDVLICSRKRCFRVKIIVCECFYLGAGIVCQVKGRLKKEREKEGDREGDGE